MTCAANGHFRDVLINGLSLGISYVNMAIGSDVVPQDDDLTVDNAYRGLILI